MPEVIDLAQFPRLSCRRCGLVTLVDPALPFDVRAELTCPNCRRPLFAGLATPSSADRPVPGRPSGDSHGAGPLPPAASGSGKASVPSHAAVGLALAGMMMLLLVALFVLLAVTPHHNYWEFLTR